MARNYHQGKYRVINTKKYKGTSTNVTYRSSFELTYFKWADRNPSILEWGAEIIVVPYYDPIKQKKRRYVVDIWMKCKTKSGTIETYLCEIKPKSQTIPPKKGRKKKQTLIEEQSTFVTNQAKWQYAEQYAKERGWHFVLITEDQLFK